MNIKKVTLVYHVYSGEISYVIINNDGECMLNGLLQRNNGLLDEGQDIDDFFIEDNEIGDYLYEVDWEALIGYPIEIIGFYCI